MADSGSDLLVSLSGGKDSTATYLHLLESGYLDRVERGGGKVYRVFADTGWELPETYAYLERLEERFGKIHRVATWVPGPGEEKPAGYDHLEPVWKTASKVMDADRWALAKLLEIRFGRYSPLIRLMVQWGKFPMSSRRWCTDDTKKRPIVGFLATLNNPVNAIGVRAEESAKRAIQPEWEWSENYDSWVWRPIHKCRLSDIIDIHGRHNLAPNPLYLQGEGSGRVGCAPCVNSTKADIRWLAKNHPERVALLDAVEISLEQVETARFKAGAGHPKWFTVSRTVDGEAVDWAVPVKDAIEWAFTTRGGKQTMFSFAGEGEPGCTQWGLCEAIRREGE